MSRTVVDGAGESKKGSGNGSQAATGSGSPDAEGGWERWVPGEGDAEIDSEELREFLAADALDVKADPVFKEELRVKLWRVLQRRLSASSEGEPD